MPRVKKPPKPDTIHYNDAARRTPDYFVGSTWCGRVARAYVQTRLLELVTCKLCKALVAKDWAHQRKRGL